MQNKAKNPLKVRIVDNSIMSQNKAIEGLSSINRKSLMPYTSSMDYWSTPLMIWLLLIVFRGYILHAHDHKPKNIYNKWSLSSYW